MSQSLVFAAPTPMRRSAEGAVSRGALQAAREGFGVGCGIFPKISTLQHVIKRPGVLRW